jgi:hypothetical protein
MRVRSTAGTTVTGACLLLLSVGAAAAHAQAPVPHPLPRIALDLRGFYSGLGRDATTAAALNVAPTDLPNRALGGVAGIHLYLLRSRKITIGIGGEGVLARGRSQQVIEDPTPPAPGQLPVPPILVQQHLRGISGQVSLNFGDRDGWSYLSAGMGPLAFYSYTGEARPFDAPPVETTINLGGGGRWFMKPHLAFCFDIRFYQTKPENTTVSYPGRARKQLLVMSAGIAVK